MKRLDTFIISKFLQLFAGAFFVCLFVFMMQFTWRYVDDLVGKGLTLDILAKFYGYMSLTLISQSLPLAVLLASLITFGNMGENLELLSMKAAGVSLTRIMRPLMIFVMLVAGASFYIQNTISPDAQKNLRQLLLSMRQSQPAVEIPEGIFYNGIPNVNLFVEKKDVKTGMLYSVMIYKTDQGFDKTQILLADSGRLEMTADKLHLRLTLWSGAQFQSLEANNGSLQWENTTMPYDREIFTSKEFLIDFDSNFNLLDEDMIGNMPTAKNMNEIVHDADSMSAILDSTALAYVEQIKMRQMARRTNMTKEDSLRVAKDVKAHPQSVDAIFAKADKEKLKRAKANANMNVQQMSYDLSWKNEVKQDEEKWIRRHWIEWHTKITLSLACLLFFFIGAPLGAIIRKGGLGTPSVISVGIFIFYYIINVSGMKMAREGNLNMIIGMWTSSFILAPAGVYLTFMSNRDSQVFNIDAYRNFFRKLLGLRVKRHLTRKEVIINAPDYTADLQHIAQLKQEFAALRVSRFTLVNYFRFRGKKTALAAPVQHLEAVIDDLANTRDLHILQALNLFPFVTKRHLRRDRRHILRALVKLEKSILVFLGRMERKKQVAADGGATAKPAVKAGQRTSIAEVEQAPVIIALSDNTNYTEALEAIEQLKKQCGTLRISNSGLVNYFRYRNNKVIDDIVRSTRALIMMLANSNDHVLQQIAKELPRMSRSNMKETRTNLMRTLAKLEKRVVAIIAHLAQLSHPDSLFEPLSTKASETTEDTPSAPIESAEAFEAEVTPIVTDSSDIAETTHEALEAETEVPEETPFIPDVPETEEALEDDELEFIEEDRADYAAILVSIATLKRECGALRISKWSIVNLFRYRDTSAIDSIVKRTKELRRQLADSDDATLQQLRNELPRLSRKHLHRDRSAMMRLLTKIEKRINEV